MKSMTSLQKLAFDATIGKDVDGRNATQMNDAVRNAVMEACGGEWNYYSFMDNKYKVFAVIAEIMGNKVERLYDVGVAGLHRLFNYWDMLSHARVIIATAGMDGVLPGIISGLVAAPVIALPTSIGYGTGKDGLSAILTMLNSCSPGLVVVNIDNGYGAGIFAHQINNIGGK